jgi:hypothetical protein
MSLQLSEIIDVDASESDSPSPLVESGTPASSMSSSLAMKERGSETLPSQLIGVELAELFSENVAAKIWRVAKSHLEREVRSPISSPFYKERPSFGFSAR